MKIGGCPEKRCDQVDQQGYRAWVGGDGGFRAALTVSDRQAGRQPLRTAGLQHRQALTIGLTARVKPVALQLWSTPCH